MGQQSTVAVANDGGVVTGDLVSLIQDLSLARGMDEIMRLVRRGARRLTGADGVTFVLRDGDQCHYADEDAVSPLWKGQRFPLESCISGWAMLHRQPVVIEDIYQDPRIPHDAYRLTFVRSLVMVPVRREDPVAAIGAYWAQQRMPTPHEVTVLETIANAAAVAITNVTLVLSLQQSTAEAQRRAEDSARQARELARALTDLQRVNDQKSRFLAACSHDLRQPFQAMRLFHSVLTDRVGPAERVVVDRLGEAMAHGEDLLHSLLDVSTLETGLISAAPTAFPLSEVLERIGRGFAAQADSHGLRLRVAPTACRVVSDPAILGRILSNLVANALKYTPAGGVVVGARRRGDRVLVQVWDSGIGIAADRLEDIFEDFYQIGNPERDKQQGIGLGLGIVRRLASLLDHPVAVSSRPGRGSVFSVSVALADR